MTANSKEYINLDLNLNQVIADTVAVIIKSAR